jgi:hypothetical protein
MKSLVLLLAICLSVSVPAADAKRITRRCALGVGGVALAALVYHFTRGESEREPAKIELFGEEHTKTEYRAKLYPQVLSGKALLLAEDYLTTAEATSTLDYAIDLYRWGLTPNPSARVKGIEDPARFLAAAFPALEQLLNEAISTRHPDTEITFGQQFVSEKIWGNPIFTPLWQKIFNRPHPIEKMASEWERVGREFPISEINLKRYLAFLNHLATEKPYDKLIRRTIANQEPLRNLGRPMQGIFHPIFRNVEDMIYLKLILQELKSEYRDLMQSRNQKIPTPWKAITRWRSELFAQSIFEAWKTHDGKTGPIYVFLGEDHAPEVKAFLIQLGINGDFIAVKKTL